MNIALQLLKRFWPDLILVAIFAALSAVAYNHGHDVATAEAEARHAEEIREIDQAAAAAMKAALAKAAQDQADALQAERANIEAQAKTEDQFKIITNTVTRYVQANPNINTCSLDADALRLWNSAHGSPTASPGASAAGTHP